MIKIKKVIHYCDYCGKKITGIDKPRNINTVWEGIKYILNMVERVSIDGDGCNECYQSFRKWVKSRKSRRYENGTKRK